VVPGPEPLPAPAPGVERLALTRATKPVPAGTGFPKHPHGPEYKRKAGRLRPRRVPGSRPVVCVGGSQGRYLIDPLRTLIIRAGVSPVIRGGITGDTLSGPPGTGKGITGDTLLVKKGITGDTLRG